MLKRLLLVCILLCTALGAAAQETDAGSAIGDVISRQLDAFNDRDVDRAFQFASPTIQGLFVNPGNFGTMVERGYPMVWTNSSARFLERRERGAAIFQLVQIEDANGAFHYLEYKMIHLDGGWRIDGVVILPPPDLGV